MNNHPIFDKTETKKESRKNMGASCNKMKKMILYFFGLSSINIIKPHQTAGETIFLSLSGQQKKLKKVIIFHFFVLLFQYFFVSL